MKNNSNIYDIDGKLVRHMSNTKGFTLKDCQDAIKHYQDRLDSSDLSKHKESVYKLYIKNLSNYMYTKMLTDETWKKQYLESTPINKTNEEEVKQILESMTQEDLLVERDTVSDNMDEYVDFEENEKD